MSDAHPQLDPVNVNVAAHDEQFDDDPEQAVHEASQIEHFVPSK